MSAGQVMQISNATSTRKKSRFRIRITSNVFRIQVASEYQTGTEISQQVIWLPFKFWTPKQNCLCWLMIKKLKEIKLKVISHATGNSMLKCTKADLKSQCCQPADTKVANLLKNLFTNSNNWFTFWELRFS